MTKLTKKDWEKKFDKVFTDLARGYSHHGVELKSFIQKTINQEVKEALERVKIPEEQLDYHRQKAKEVKNISVKQYHRFLIGVYAEVNEFGFYPDQEGKINTKVAFHFTLRRSYLNFMAILKRYYNLLGEWQNMGIELI